MPKKILAALNTTAGRMACILALLSVAWLWHADLNSTRTAQWITSGNGTFGQVFDLGLAIGLLMGVGIGLALPNRKTSVAK